jgi:hypothetical protein
MGDGLSRNTTVSHMKIYSSLDQTLSSALAMALPSNSTLQRLDLDWQNGDDDNVLSPVLLALGKNMGIKDVSVGGLGSIDESLCTAMKDGLGTNTTLESLKLKRLHLTNDNSDLWCRALSFLRTNNDLKTLKVSLDDDDVTASSIAAFRTDIAAMLQENASLESFSIQSFNRMPAKEYVALVTALKHNRTLKALYFHASTIPLTDDEDKQMAVLLRKNFALESLPDIINQGRDVGAILRLNKAGRRYLVQDGSSISKGVEVLSAVSNELNCVFLHLLENPRLCVRSAVETASAGTEGSGGSTSPANHNGKREQEQDQALEEGKDSRRRRT